MIREEFYVELGRKVMLFSKRRPINSNNLLLLTSSGGGGLLQAAVAKQQEVLEKEPDTVIIRRDLLKDWMGLSSSFLINFWNRAQQKGNLRAQNICVWGQFLFDAFVWPRVFAVSLYTLFRYNIDRIIDTQPMGTSALLLAIRLYNRKRKKKVVLEKVLVDLPTKKATHFFRPIRKLTEGNRKYLRLTTIFPLLEPGETEEQFWQRNCRLQDAQICYEDLYVRKAFKGFQGKPRTSEETFLRLLYKEPGEFQLMRRAFRRGKVQAELTEKTVGFRISAESRVITILLGSQPSEEATCSYVKRFIQLAKESNSSKAPIYLFVFSAECKGEGSLFQKIVEVVSRAKNYPAHLTVIPFSFQTDEEIAPLFHRSDLTITRSGGQTAMELMGVGTGQMCIHSEAKKNGKEPLTEKDLLRGIPGWEAENAVYLQKVRGAFVVTPDVMLPVARKVFRSAPSQGALREMQSSA